MAWLLWLLLGVSALIFMPLVRRALAVENPLQLELVNRDLREALAQKERLLADYDRCRKRYPRSRVSAFMRCISRPPKISKSEATGTMPFFSPIAG